MKKYLCALLLAVNLLIPLFSQALLDDENSRQTLVPEKMYVGDNAEIQYTFRSAIDFFALADKKMINGDVLNLNLSHTGFNALSQLCTVSRVYLVRSDLYYTLFVYLTPWKPGKIDFAPFDLNLACRKNTNNPSAAGDDVHFYIDLAPVKVSSLAEEMSVSALKPPIPPLSVPGTNYILWLLIILLIVLLILIGVIMVKLPLILGKWTKLKGLYGFKKNSRNTKKKLRSLLQKKNLDDKEFALRWQQILRKYLEYRFSTSFESVPGSEIGAAIAVCTGDMLLEEQQSAVDGIASSFVRTDYVRFASGSIDSELLPLKEHQASFLEGERASIINATLENVLLMEKEADRA
jgi:Sec-independent protein translocase protein TatA